jgi:hypothetical protein
MGTCASTPASELYHLHVPRLQDLPGVEGPSLFVSRTGKPPGLHLQATDFVQVRTGEHQLTAHSSSVAP